MGCAASIIFTVMGASYGTAKSAGAIFSSGIIRPDRLMQNTYVYPLHFWPVGHGRGDPGGRRGNLSLNLVRNITYRVFLGLP
jgi:hypothetical protein